MLNKHYTFYDVYKYLLAISLIVIYAFSNLTLISIGFQLLFIFVSLIIILNRRAVFLSVHFYWMFSFLLWTLITTFFSVNQANSLNDILNLTVKFIFYTAVIMFVDNQEKFLYVLKTITAAGCLLIVRLILFTPFSVWGTERLGEDIGLNPNAIGIALSISTITTLYLVNYYQKKSLYLIIMPLITVGLFTGSKKAFIAIILGLSLLMFFTSRGFIKKLKMIIISIVVFLILLFISFNVPFFYDVIGSRIEAAVLYANNSGIDKSTLTRQAMINEGIELFVRNPILGYGINNFNELTTFKGYSHNNFIELLLGSGLIGTLIYYSLPIGLLIYSIIKSIKNSNVEYSIVAVLLIIILFLDIANVSYRQLMTQVMIALCVSKMIINKDIEFENKEIEIR